MNNAVAQENKQTLSWILSPVYGMTCLLFGANFYSFGVSLSPTSILLWVLLLGPIYGIVSVALDALVFKLTGPWFGGKTNYASFFVAISCSKAPSFLLLAVWGILLVADPSSTFMQNVSNDSAVTIVVSSLIVSLWSFFLLTKHLQRLQGFTYLTSFLYTLFNYILLFFMYIIISFAARYIYISSF